MEVNTDTLLERDGEVAVVRQLLDDARRGAGSVLLVEGPPGVGKTRILLAARDAASEAGFGVLATRAGELERELAWGVVRSLFEPALRDLPDSEESAVMDGAARLALPVLGREAAAVPAGAQDALASALHGLHWLTANLALRHPLLVAVDDAHWADGASWRWLAYMTPRLAELPLLLMLAARPLEVGPHAQSLRSLRSASRVLHPAPLSRPASVRLVRRVLVPTAEDRFCESCHEVTGGNPFLLLQLVRELERQGVLPLDVNAHRVEGLGARAVSDSVADRLARLSDDAQRLAGAIAVLGHEARLIEAARLAALDADTAARAADELADARLVTGDVTLAFVHPLVRSAVYEGLPQAQRARSHARAAELLGGGDVPADRLVAHLVFVDPSGDAQVVSRLARAAELALARGAPDAAVSYLRRALVEPPPDVERAFLLRLLGRAEVAVSGPGGLPSLEAALEASRDPGERAHIALEISRSARMWADFKRGTRALDRALDGLAPDSGLARRLEGELINLAAGAEETVPLAVERIAPYLDPGAAERLRDPGLLADLAMLAVVSCQPRDVGLSLARRALAALAAQDPDPSVRVFVSLALASTGELAEARAVWDGALEAARASGSMLSLAFGIGWRAPIVLRMGDVCGAEADSQTCTAIYHSWGHRSADWILGEALLERGALDEAEGSIKPENAPSGSFDYLVTLYTRGRLRLAQRRPADAATDLLEVGRRWTAMGYLTPGLFPWRSTAALAVAHLGEADRARELAEEELGLARAAGVPHAIGVALSRCGLLDDGEEGLTRMREAAELLAGSQARLEHARAVCELGARLRREGRRSEAKSVLKQALDLADRCGAAALAARARDELVAAGARPRRARLSGPEALTASELRVARMAAEGHTNREIAQALFVSVPTVETHLGHAYQKLDIRSRRQLPEALPEESPLEQAETLAAPG